MNEVRNSGCLMTPHESKTYAERLLKVANPIVAGMIIVLSVAPQRVSTTMAVLGMLSTPTLYAGAYLLLRRGKD